MAKGSSGFKVGDRVAYAARFLRNIQAITGGYGDRRGTITRVDDVVGGKFHLVKVRWDDGAELGALDVNLVHADRIHLEPA